MLPKPSYKIVALFISVFIHSSLVAASMYMILEPAKKQSSKAKKMVVTLNEYVPLVEPKLEKRVEKKVKAKPVIKKKVLKKKKLVEKKKPVPKPLKSKTKKKVEERVQKRVVSKASRVLPTKKKKPLKAKKDSIDPTLLDSIRYLIQSSLRYPSMARRLKLEGVVLISFKLDKEARVVLAEVETSSGSSLLDARALETVESLSGSYPRLSKEIELKIPIAFSLNK